MITLKDSGSKDMTGAKWRLVYDKNKFIALIEGTEDTVTTTSHLVEEFGTKKEAIERIRVMGLEYEPEVEFYA